MQEARGGTQYHEVRELCRVRREGGGRAAVLRKKWLYRDEGGGEGSDKISKYIKDQKSGF